MVWPSRLQFPRSADWDVNATHTTNVCYDISYHSSRLYCSKVPAAVFFKEKSEFSVSPGPREKISSPFTIIFSFFLPSFLSFFLFFSSILLFFFYDFVFLYALFSFVLFFFSFFLFFFLFSFLSFFPLLPLSFGKILEPSRNTQNLLF